MATVVQKASKGNRAAMERLYRDNGRRVYALALNLLQNRTAAGNATVWVFKNAWKSLDSNDVFGESQYAEFVTRRTAAYCKKQVLKQNPRAFQVSSAAQGYGGKDTLPGAEDDPRRAVLSALGELRRFVLVLKTQAGYEEHQIADVVGLNPRTIEMVSGGEREAVERLLARTPEEGRLTYESLKARLRDGENSVELPEDVDERVNADIDRIAAPIEARAKKRARVAAAAVVAACVCAAAAVLIFGGVKGWFSSEDGGTASETSSAVGEVSGTSETEDDATESVEDVSSETSEETSAAQAAAVAEATYYADIDIQDYGTVTVALDGNAAPKTVENFVQLARSGFYDGLTFHRIMDGFMMQGGDPNGDGTGGSDETVSGEFESNGFENDLSHTRGAISMARSSGDNDSASSQFFIVQADSTFLDGDYACFGYVTDGMDVVDAICAAAQPTDDNGTIPADEQPVITSVAVREA